MRRKPTKKQKEELIKKFGHVPTKEEIFERLKASQERLMWALSGALETAPDDPKLRKQLLQAIEKAATLRGKVYRDILKEKPPQPKTVDKKKGVA
ncbi:MAG: hypothetical protein A2126_00170 [Candidatus Woykebacteria bacterium GWB1_45_5]|uniref:Uncharacterized protein n=2 Tax=Candidatus Woykeibacteriota TaxID=1817899 RepID=A0A1G1W2R6_9BACT|nr:MAG: hypothetical protein A2113_01240 [Candidatus Woykebacteria bacterium GWA1_44_8]OGY22593.1 MAG: hypothetical protein A2126_00170 [Candidatus Woykebacteria bacterium GWB1_45_5]